MWMTLLSSKEKEHSHEFFQHINSIEEKIKFTAESTRADGSMPFLDTLVTHLEGMEVWKPEYTESPLIQINICSGTATMPLTTNTAS